MKNLRVVLALASCLVLSACDESYDGTLNLQQPLTLNIKKGTLVVPMGQQRAQVKASSSKIKLKLKVDGKDSEVTFALPKGQKIKSFNDVNIAPEVSGQPYHLKGEENTDYSDSSPVRTTESCTFSTLERQCGYETTPRTCRNENVCGLQPDGTQVCHAVPVCSGGDTNYVCRDVSVTHYGTQDVEYYMSYSTTNRAVNIIDPSSQQTIGQFTNESTKSRKNYTHQSQCYEGRRF